MKKGMWSLAGMALVLTMTFGSSAGVAMAAEKEIHGEAERSVIMSEMMRGARGSNSFEGKYLSLSVSAGPSKAWGTVGNNDYNTKHYARVETKAYDKSGKVLYTGSNSGVIEAGALAAMKNDISGTVAKATATGKIYKETTAKTLLQSKTITATVN